MPYFVRDNAKYTGATPVQPKAKQSPASLSQSAPSVKTHLPNALKERRSEIKEIAKGEIVGRPIYLPVLNVSATISNKGVKEWLNQPHEHIEEKNELLLNIESVLKNASYIGSGVDLHDQTTMAHLYEISIKGDKSWIIIREMNNGDIKIHSISDSKDIVYKILGKKIKIAS